MPLYEYKCQSCGEKFEVIQKFSDAPLEVHDACGGGPVERLISPSALQFKGSGWYVTDYAGGNGKSQSSKDSKDGKDGKDSKEGKKEGKSEGSSSASESSSKTETKAPATTTSSSDKSDKKV